MATPAAPFTYSGRDQNHTEHTLSVTPGHPHPGLLAGNHSLPAGGAGGGGRHEVEVELYTVIVCCIAMVAFGALGLLSNMALLLSTKCKKSIRHIQFGLPYCLASVNVVLCLFWVPLEALRIVLNYCHVGLHPVMCHLEVALFYFSVSTLVFVNVFLSIHRILQFLCICMMQSVYILAGIGVSAVLGVVFALSVSLDYERTVDFRVCTQSWPVSDSRLSIIAVAINTLWVLVLLIISCAMLVVVVVQRQRMTCPQRHCTTNVLTKDYICQKQTDDLEEAKQQFLNAIPEGGNRPITSEKKTKCKLQPEGSGKKKLTFGIPNKAEKEGSQSEGSDDDFDQRMKMKLQKSLSGRRHTVANIGLGESSFGGHRGSIDAGKSGNGSHGYNYVRKWSVDIVALQDQLENPRAFLKGAASASGALSTLTDKNTAKSQSTSSNKITGSITEEHNEADATSPTASGSNGQAATDTETDKILVEDMKPPEEPPAADNNMDNAVANGNPSGDHLSVVESSVNDTVDDDCEPVLDKKEIVQSLQVNTVCLVLLLTVLACVLPFALLHFLQVVMDSSLNRNMTWVLAALCVIQSPVHVFLIAWMERKLWHALRRLHAKLTHWKCVCYCNIGKGRKCFERRDRQAEPSC